ncbi:MAG: glycosyltransferase family 2 protein [Sphingomonadaceae bacterium]
MIGIVAIGRNEGERLIRCLDSLPRDGSIIVYVDSGSTDGSIAAAQARGAQVVALDMTQPFTAARARNAGLAALQEAGLTDGYVQFIDGDCALDPAWLPTASAFLNANPRVAVACGRRRERFPEASIYNQLCDYEWDTPIGEAQHCGGDALMRLEPVLAAGGYDATLVAGEEPELCSRLRQAGWKIWRLDAPMTLHDAAILRFGQWWMRSVRSGFGYTQVWDVTRGRANRAHGHEVGRTAVWGGAIPLAILAAALASPLALAAFALYPVQVARIAARQGFSRSGWLRATFTMLAKFPELQGMARYARRRLSGGANTAILYK